MVEARVSASMYASSRDIPKAPFRPDPFLERWAGGGEYGYCWYGALLVLQQTTGEENEQNTCKVPAWVAISLAPEL